MNLNNCSTHMCDTELGLWAVWLHTAFSPSHSQDTQPAAASSWTCPALSCSALAFTLLWNSSPARSSQDWPFLAVLDSAQIFPAQRTLPMALPSKTALPVPPSPAFFRPTPLLHYFPCFSVALPAVWCYIMHRLFSFAGLILYESGDFAGLVSVISTSTPDKVPSLYVCEGVEENIPLGVSAYKQGHIGLDFSFHILTIDKWVGLLDI